MPKKGQYQYSQVGYSLNNSLVTLSEAIAVTPAGAMEKKVSDLRMHENRDTRKQDENCLTLDSDDFIEVPPGASLRCELEKHLQHDHDFTTIVNTTYEGRYTLHYMIPAYECDTVLGQRWRMEEQGGRIKR